MGRRLRCAGCGRACEVSEFSPANAKALAADRVCQNCEHQAPPQQQQQQQEEHYSAPQQQQQQAAYEEEEPTYAQEEEAPQQQEEQQEAPVEAPAAPAPAAGNIEPAAELPGGAVLNCGIYDSTASEDPNAMRFFTISAPGRLNYRPNEGEEFFGSYELDPPTQEEEDKGFLGAMFVHWVFHVKYPAEGEPQQTKVDQEGGTLFVAATQDGSTGLIAGDEFFAFAGPCEQ